MEIHGQVQYCTLSDSIWYSIWHTRKTAALRQGHCRITGDGKTKWNSGLCGTPPLETCSPAVWEERVCFKLGAISLEQTAAGQFTSSMNNAQTLGRWPPSSLLSATMDRHPSFETGDRRSNVWRLNNGAGSPKSWSCVVEPRPLLRGVRHV